MKRDWNLLRRIMLAIEDDSFKCEQLLSEMAVCAPADLDAQKYVSPPCEKVSRAEKMLFQHLLMLKDAGLIDGKIALLGSLCCSQLRLTMAGYDVLDCLRSEKYGQRSLRP